MGAESESLRVALVEEVTRIKDEYAYPDLGRAFQHWSAVNVLGVEDKDVADELAGAMGADGGIDYFHVNDENKSIEIIQAKFTDDQQSQVDQRAILEFYEIPRKLSIGRADHNSRFCDQQEEYKRLKAQKYETRLIFVTTSNMSEQTKNAMTLQNRNLESDTTFECFELKDLIAYVGNPSSPPCELRVVKNECFVGAPNGSQIKRMVATVSAPELKKICESVGAPTLFSLNPRSFLGDTTISKNIKKTIDNTPEKLWHYNNGISAICKHFEYDEKAGIAKIDNLKVVNGCQTITTIANMREVDPNAGLVLRLSETTDTAFSENISKFTNDQNSIKSPDLLSNHEYMISLESQFRKYDRFFFERKKGQRPKVQSRKALYVIKNVDAARLKMAYALENPHLSMQLPETKIFRFDPKDANVSSTFTELYKDADPKDMIVPHIFYYMFGMIKKEIAKNNTGFDDNDNQNIKFLLKYKIGQYYVIGIIGKIFRSMNTSTKNDIIDAIIDSVIKYDTDIISKMVKELINLVRWIALVIPEILGDTSNKYLHEHELYYLRDPLRKDNKLPDLYRKRESSTKYEGRRCDLFETHFCDIFNIPHR